MILTPEIDTSNITAALNFYKGLYSEVHVLVCDKCKSELAIEVVGAVDGLQQNSLGMTVIPVNEKLLGSRVRLDGVMGYQCICGNDTRANHIEESLSPTGQFLPHEVHAINEQMSKKSFRPYVKIKGNKLTVETFTRVRIK